MKVPRLFPGDWSAVESISVTQELRSLCIRFSFVYSHFVVPVLFFSHLLSAPSEADLIVERIETLYRPKRRQKGVLIIQLLNIEAERTI